MPERKKLRRRYAVKHAREQSREGRSQEYAARAHHLEYRPAGLDLGTSRRSARAIAHGNVCYDRRGGTGLIPAICLPYES